MKFTRLDITHKIIKRQDCVNQTQKCFVLADNIPDFRLSRHQLHQTPRRGGLAAAMRPNKIGGTDACPLYDVHAVGIPTTSFVAAEALCQEHIYEAFEKVYQLVGAAQYEELVVPYKDGQPAFAGGIAGTLPKEIKRLIGTELDRLEKFLNNKKHYQTLPSSYQTAFLKGQNDPEFSEEKKEQTNHNHIFNHYIGTLGALTSTDVGDKPKAKKTTDKPKAKKSTDPKPGVVVIVNKPKSKKPAVVTGKTNLKISTNKKSSDPKPGVVVIVDKPKSKKPAVVTGKLNPKISTNKADTPEPVVVSDSPQKNPKHHPRWVTMLVKRRQRYYTYLARTAVNAAATLSMILSAAAIYTNPAGLSAALLALVFCASALTFILNIKKSTPKPFTAQDTTQSNQDNTKSCSNVQAVFSSPAKSLLLSANATVQPNIGRDNSHDDNVPSQSTANRPT